MNLQQIKYVSYTAKYNSFSRAAKELFVTQPNVSSAVKELEQELNIQIFERSKGGVSLTREGVVLLSQITPVMEQMHFIENYYAEEQEYKNVLSIACQHCPAVQRAMIELLRDHAKQDNYKMQLLEIKTKEVLQYVHEGMAEAGVLLRNRSNKILLGEIEQNNLRFELLEERMPFVYLCKTHPLASKELITKEDLAPYPYVKYYQGQNSMQFYSEEVVEDHEADKTIIVTDSATLSATLEQLDAYTIGSGYRGTREVNNPNTKYRVVPYDTDEVIELGIITRNDSMVSALCQQFIKKLKSVVSSSCE